METTASPCPGRARGEADGFRALRRRHKRSSGRGKGRTTTGDGSCSPVRVYLAEGNRAEALAAYEHYLTLLRTELGLEPTPLIRALIKDSQP
ncbi:MAG: hypothetical protein GEU75_14400 [Dehalococcoidia bacterium]|nr:hypothetical protein [Dehalococcoidia bacterium]